MNTEWCRKTSGVAWTRHSACRWRHWPEKSWRPGCSPPLSGTLDLISASNRAPVSATVYRVHSSRCTPLIFNTPSLYYPSPLFSYVIDSFVLHQLLFPTVTHTNLNFNFASTNLTLLWINVQLSYIGSKTNRNLLEFFGYEMVLISVNGNAKGSLWRNYFMDDTIYFSSCRIHC